MLGGALTSMPGSSATFRGGLIVYATDLKEALAGVPGPLLAAEGAVSAEVAAALAAGARDRVGATYAVALTGVAGPDPQDGRPPGTVDVAVAGPAGGRVRELQLPGDRAAVRAAAVDGARVMLREALHEDASSLRG
jgi:nicotinamide-nucleotide amidase